MRVSRRENARLKACCQPGLLAADLASETAATKEHDGLYDSARRDNTWQAKLLAHLLTLE